MFITPFIGAKKTIFKQMSFHKSTGSKLRTQGISIVLITKKFICKELEIALLLNKITPISFTKFGDAQTTPRGSLMDIPTVPLQTRSRIGCKLSLPPLK